MLVYVDKNKTRQTDIMTTDELRQLMAQIDEDVISITHQLEMLKIRERTITTTEQRWAAGARAVLARKRLTKQHLIREIGERTRQEMMAQRPFAEFFMDVCRERMTEFDFDNLFAEALERRERDFDTVVVEAKSRREREKVAVFA